MSADKSVHITVNPHDQGVLAEILENTRKLLAQGVKLMGKADEMKQDISDIKTTVDEIDTDIDGLIARLDGGLSPAEAIEVQGELRALKARLRGTADKA